MGHTLLKATLRKHLFNNMASRECNMQVPCGEAQASVKASKRDRFIRARHPRQNSIGSVVDA